jgi:2-methylcitrate dehydratase PrpD
LSVTEQLAEAIASVQYADLPGEAIDRAKLHILDHIGVTLAGGRSPLGNSVLGLGLSSGDSTVIGFDAPASLPAAAFINGTLAHALDIDDTAAGTVAHPSAPILPALFGFAERDQLSGEQLLTAYVLGLEVFYRIALASEQGMAGWHRTSLFGAPAAAAAAAKLLNFDRQRIRIALGISGSLTGGMQMNFGTMTKAIQVGNASRSGVLAAQLANADCSANPDLFDDPNGFGNTFYAGRFSAEKTVADFGSPYSILFPGIGLKIHPCCGLTHAPADIALALAHQHDIVADDIAAVVVYGEPLWPDVLVHHEPTTGYQGKYSVEYVVAAAIIDRQIQPETFSDSQVNRPELQVFLRKVELRVRTPAEWNDLRKHAWNHSAEVIIRMNNGTEYRADAPCARGYPDLPLSEQQVLEKFSACAGPTLSAQAIDGLVETALSLEHEQDISQLLGLTRPS